MIRKFLNDERGQGMSEYGIMLAVVAIMLGIFYVTYSNLMTGGETDPDLIEEDSVMGTIDSQTRKILPKTDD